MLSIPFPGNKKYSYKRVRDLFTRGGYDTVVEPFGGSCIISVNLFNDGLAKDAHINDYDDLFGKYPRLIELREWIKDEMFAHGIYRSTGTNTSHHRFTDETEQDFYYVKSPLLKPDDKEFLRSLIAQIDPEWWRLLAYGSCYTHACVASHAEVRLYDFNYFQGYIYTDKQRKYLDVINTMDRDTLDWRDFLEKHREIMGENVLVILDPPYFSKNNHSYQGTITESDTVELLELMRDLDVDFLFFNHNPDWVEEKLIELGMDNYTIEMIGSSHNTMSKERKDTLAYVRQNKRSNESNSQTTEIIE